MAYDSNPTLSAITQEISLNRSGLVADAIFPQVQTESNFSYLDWTKEIKNLKANVDDSVSCKTKAKRIDEGELELKSGVTSGHALTEILEVCNFNVCGRPDLINEVHRRKTANLANKLLLGREQRAISLATDASKYTDNSTNKPFDANAVIDGGKFAIAANTFFGSSYDARKYLSGVNDFAVYGRKNIAVMDRATLNALISHPSFIGIGLQPFARTTEEQLAALLNVEKIVVADGVYNDGIGNTLNLKKVWPANTILFTTSREFITSTDSEFSFGISAYTQLLTPTQWFDENYGISKGANFIKIGHDLTETVLSYKAATLVQFT